MDAMSCLAPPPPAASFLSPAYYTDDVIARALHYSISDHYSYSPAAFSSPSSSSSLLADLPFSGGGSNCFASTAPAPATGLTCDSVLVSSDAPPQPHVTPVAGAAANKRRVGLGPAGRAGKRRPRASKRAPTTYITTDPSNFRLMVQHVTGVQAEPAGGDDGVLQMPASFDASSATAALLDCHPPFDASPNALPMPSSDGDAAAALQQRLQQQQQPCYPTLDSWSVMYESAELL